jgi:putative cardiolipin synthase
MTREYTSAMEKAGVDVKLYNSTFFLSPTQSRLHQKILLIDGKEVLLGGRNIKNDYFGLNAESLYQDRDIWIYGPIGFNIKWAFESYFFHKDSYRPANFINIQAPVTQNKLDSLSAKERIKVEKRLRQSEKFLLETTELIFIKNKIQEIGERQLAASPVVMTKDLEFVADRPGKNKSSRVIGHALFRSIENTEEEVLLEAPYFIMLSEGKRMVKALLEDDIPFTLMTNSRYSIGKSSIPIAYVIEHLGKQHVRDGMTIYGYSGNSLDLQDVVIPLEPKGRSELHGKSAVIGKMSYVGTYNMDPRSKDYNAELGIIFRNTPEIVDLLKISYEQIINNSMLLAPDGGYVASELYDEVKRRRGDSDNVIENIKFFFVNALFKKII